MKETLRCCIACILPCGALDVIRIVHSNGYVEEISGKITASEVMKAHPKHVLKKPSSLPSSDHDDVISATKIVIVPPEAELQRGKIYFLMPATKPDKEKIRRERSNANADKKRSRHREEGDDHKSNGENNGKDTDSSVLISDRCLRSVGFDLIRPLRYGPFGLKAQSRRLLGPSRLIVSIGFSSFSYRGLEPSRGSSEAVSEPVIL
ncbi:hypothetical protein Rs2_21609 [Raphanus sativus]|nr:hypothetical protein Rs2_21609 [Raphanus sativus]